MYYKQKRPYRSAFIGAASRIASAFKKRYYPRKRSAARTVNRMGFKGRVGAKVSVKKRKVITSHVNSNPSVGITYTKFTKKRKLRAYLRNLRKLHYQQETTTLAAQRISWPVAQQGMYSIDIFNATDLQNIWFANFGTSTLLTSRVFVSKYTARIHFTNATNNNVEVSIYNCMPRENIPSTAGTYDITNPGAAWDLQSTNTMYHPTAGWAVPTKAQPLNTPFYSPQFLKNYCIKSVKKIQMSAGANHIHHAYVDVNKWFNYMDTQEGVKLYRDRSYNFVVTFRAMPTNDNDDKGKIAFGSGAVNMLWQVNYDGYVDEDNVKVVASKDDQGVIVTEKVMLEYPEVAATVTVA